MADATILMLEMDILNLIIFNKIVYFNVELLCGGGGFERKHWFL